MMKHHFSISKNKLSKLLTLKKCKTFHSKEIKTNKKIKQIQKHKEKFNYNKNMKKIKKMLYKKDLLNNKQKNMHLQSKIK